VTEPRVSIVLVTRNGVATLPALLDMVSAQRFDGGVEIVAVDSSSTDGTLELLRSRVRTLMTIAPESFDHGLTRNHGIEKARGEFVVLLVQDAVPASDQWLGALVAPLESDQTVAGTFARQIPRTDSRPLTRHYAGRWVAASTAPRTTRIAGRAAFAALAPDARLERCAFDNVCSCIRRSVWSTLPFSAAPFAEDLEWAKTVLLAGHTLVYAPDAAVIHSHDRSAAYEFERTRLLHQRLYDLFGMRTIPTGAALVRAIGASLALHASIEPTPRALALALAWPLGQYLGGRDGVRAAAPR